MQRAPSSPTISALGVHPFMIDGERFSKVFLSRFAFPLTMPVAAHEFPHTQQETLLWKKYRFASSAAAAWAIATS